ncbi:hypothetical protein JTE90_018235 [Oedothorax gibbosus]|uniref:Uncharacterized protein n=1 Tax=Oedothorax gibbosus TaxID=931172 RepID=A0AAV6U952_9ARAC|nr:hypothetical protein JTE90_018235 [Oedothorax gibbosus]
MPGSGVCDPNTEIWSHQDDAVYPKRIPTPPDAFEKWISSSDAPAHESFLLSRDYRRPLRATTKNLSHVSQDCYIIAEANFGRLFFLPRFET